MLDANERITAMAKMTIKLTQLSMTMLDGTIMTWLKQEGEQVAAGESVVEVETDKVVMPITTPISGFLHCLVAEGETITVGTDIFAVFDTLADVESANLDRPCTIDQDEEATAPTAARKTVIAEKKARVSPLARKLAVEFDLAYHNLKGTGPAGVIVKADIIKAQKEIEQAMRIAPDTVAIVQDNKVGRPVPYSVEPLRGIRKKTAEALMLSKKTAADATTFAEIDMSNIKEMKAFFPLTYTAFAVRAAGKALTEYAYVNAAIHNDSIHVYEEVNICVAVATAKGLITPVVRHADKKNLLTIAADITLLSEKGKSGDIASSDLTGGTFTVTNSGVFGALMFTPIINHPQCAILGMGKVMDTAVVRNKEMVVAPMMYLSLTYDHRLVDGEIAVRFLQRIKYYMENPKEVLIN